MGKPGQVPEPEKFRCGDVCRVHAYPATKTCQVIPVPTNYVVGLPAPRMVVFVNGDIAPFSPGNGLGYVPELENLDIELICKGSENMVYLRQFFLFSSRQDVVGLRFCC